MSEKSTDMSKSKQNLSALIDGELKSGEIDDALDALSASPEQQHTWRHAYQMRALFQKDTQLASVNLVDKIAQELSHQETYSMSDEEVASNIHKLTMANKEKMPRKRYSYLTGIFALAASVIGLALLFGSPRLATYFNNSDSTQISQKALDSGLQSMIVQHGEFSGTVALNGLIAYAKVINNPQDVSVHK